MITFCFRTRTSPNSLLSHSSGFKQAEHFAGLDLGRCCFSVDVLCRRVMDHWGSSTCTTVHTLNTPDISCFWKILVPRLAQAHPFLKHSILAVAGAHMAHLDAFQRKGYFEFARRHHIYSSWLFRSYSVLGIEGCYASFAFCILTNITSLSLPNDDASTLENFITFLDLLRKSIRFTDSVSKKPGEYLETGTNFSSGRQAEDVRLDADNGLLGSLETLHCSNLVSTTSSADYQNVMTEAIDRTRDWYNSAFLYPSNLVFIVSWVILMTDEFFAQLRQRNRMSLALLGHWIVHVRLTHQTWYMQSWPEKVMAAIDQELGLLHRHNICWALEKMESTGLEHRRAATWE